MTDMMAFPETVEEYMEQYKITDRKQIYTNGTELVPIFRMKQWFGHKPERKKGRWILSEDRDWKTCSECGADVDVSMGLGIFVDNDEVSEMRFCPNCGSYNGEGEEHD